MSFSSREDSSSTGNPQGTSYNAHYTDATTLSRLRGGAGEFLTFTNDATLSNPGGSGFIGDYSGISSRDRDFDTYPVWTSIRTGVNNARTQQLCYLNCYGFLSPATPVTRSFAHGTSFNDFWEINTEPAFGGSRVELLEPRRRTTCER